VQAPEEGAVAIAAIDDINEPALATAGSAVQMLPAEAQLLQGDHTEPMFLADFLEGGLLLGRSALRDFGRGRVGEAHRQRPPRMVGAARLQEQRGLHEALAQHQVDLKVGPQGIAGEAHARDFAAGLAHQGVVLAGINPLGAAARMGQRLGEERLEGRLDRKSVV
jgi:hypothetical protein